MAVQYQFCCCWIAVNPTVPPSSLAWLSYLLTVMLVMGCV